MLNLNSLIKNLLPKSLVKVISSKLHTRQFLSNLHKDSTLLNQPRVLISYLPDPYLGSLRTTHTNGLEAMQIVNSFAQLGFSIDLFHILDNKHDDYIEKQDYDVVFGFGHPYRYAIESSPKSCKIMYLTELHPSFSYSQEQKRIAQFEKRSGKRVNVVRSGVCYNKGDIQGDYGIMMANEYTARTYNGCFSKSFFISPTPLQNNNFKIEASFKKKSAKRFLWFGSTGVIHKGLDLLIESFSCNQDLELVICGLSENERSLFGPFPNNITYQGKVDVQSSLFLNIISEASFVVFPSCSEAKSTAVLTCMNHGLIPVITKEVGIDVHNFGFFIEDIEIKSISKQLKTISEIEKLKLESMSQACYTHTRENYNIKKFSGDLNNILDEIVGDRAQ